MKKNVIGKLRGGLGNHLFINIYSFFLFYG